VFQQGIQFEGIVGMRLFPAADMGQGIGELEGTSGTGGWRMETRSEIYQLSSTVIMRRQNGG
jgi:hypothetical protein